jgi:tetrahydromethanopterin S-methyltransferase subunit D
MTARRFSFFAAVVMIVIAFLHFARAALNLPITIDGFDIPQWVSWSASVAVALLSLLGFYAAERG